MLIIRRTTFNRIPEVIPQENALYTFELNLMCNEMTSHLVVTCTEMNLDAFA